MSARAALRLTARYDSSPLASAPRRSSIDGSPNDIFRLQSSLPAIVCRPSALPRMCLSATRDTRTSHLRAFDRPCWSLQSLLAAPPRALADAEINHLLSLAQLQVSAAEMQPLMAHMQRFLSFLETVKAADACECAPMHALPCRAVEAALDARDVACDDAPLHAVMCNAAWQQESMFAVPKAIDD